MTYNETASGGIVSAGDSLSFFSYNISILGGSLAAGPGIYFSILIPIVSAGITVNGYCVIAETVFVSGTTFAAGNAFLTLGFDPSGGIVLNGLSPFFGTTNLTFDSAGLLLEGSSSVAIAPKISGGSLTAGASLISIVIVMRGGVVDAGVADVTFKPLIGGVKIASRTVESVVYYSNRFRIHRFQIGNIIYVLSQYTNRYVRQAILERLTVANKDYWRVGLGWYSDKSVLSYDEFKVWRQRS